MASLEEILERGRKGRTSIYNSWEEPLQSDLHSVIYNNESSKFSSLEDLNFSTLIKKSPFSTGGIPCSNGTLETVEDKGTLTTIGGSAEELDQNQISNKPVRSSSVPGSPVKRSRFYQGSTHSQNMISK
jgi:hypothetical protein